MQLTYYLSDKASAGSFAAIFLVCIDDINLPKYFRFLGSLKSFFFNPGKENLLKNTVLEFDPGNMANGIKP